MRKPSHIRMLSVWTQESRDCMKRARREKQGVEAPGGALAGSWVVVSGEVGAWKAQRQALLASFAAQTHSLFISLK